MTRQDLSSENVGLALGVGQRALGRTGLQISVLGFGASALGDVFGTTDVAEGRRAVHMAIDAGIDFFDVSPFYGLGLAEERLGAALDGRRHEVVLSTKCGRYGMATFDFSSGRITAGLEASLSRLRTDHVDVLLAHDIEFGDFEQIVHETIPAMRRLQEQGKTRSVGISAYPLGALCRVAQAVPVDVMLSYCHYNLLADDLESTLLPVVQAQGIGLINGSALHMGLLTDQGAPAWHPAPTAMRVAAEHAARFCREHGEDLADIALRFCLHYGGVQSTLVGMSTRSQVQSSLRALKTPPDADFLNAVRLKLAPVYNTFWVSGRAQNQ